MTTTNLSDLHTELAIALSLLPPYLQQAAVDALRNGKKITELLDHPSFIAPLRSKRVTAREAMETASSLELTIATIGAPNYPVQLLDLHTPPFVLFIKGQLPPWERSILSIVGSRSASVLTCQHTSQVAVTLADAGHVVASGLALGIDGASHRGALQSAQPGSTIAVLAHGLDTTYPRSHTLLAHQIVEQQGALISEYTPGTQPLRHHFLARNRIIAALAKTTIVSEAGERSGSLVTAQVALDLGREVVVLTNPHSESLSEGSDRLISDGAISVSTAEEILSLLCTTSQSTQPNPNRRVSKETTIPLSELLRISNYSVGYLLQLELDGHLTRLPGNTVRIANELFDKICLPSSEK